MTLSNAPTPSPPDPLSTGIRATGGAPAASAETRQSNSEDRWARWAVKGASRDFVSQRRFQIIAGVIAAGLTAWLMWTM